jgi:creatinine amidohydrolase/Fe(II)-dependent formamide hydrolase-like protein
MAIDLRGVAKGLLAVGTDGKTGVTGDPSRATTALGKQLLELKIAAAVRQIRQKRAAGP